MDRQGRLWAGTWGAGLQRYDAGRKAFVRGTKVPWTRSDERIQDFLEDHRGAVWVATWGSGLVRIDPDTNEAARHEADPSDATRLSHGNVAALFEDRRGLLWIGTGGGGLNSLDLMGQPFRTLAPRGANVHDVRAVLEDRQGRLWAGTAGGGLLRLDRSGRVTGHYRHATSDPESLSDDNVQALLEDRDGQLWVGTMGGLDRLDHGRGRFVHHRHDPGSPDSLSHDSVLIVRGWRGPPLGRHAAWPEPARARRASLPTFREAGWSRPTGARCSDGDRGGHKRSPLGRPVRHPCAARPIERRARAVPLLIDGAEDRSIAWSIRKAPSGVLWVGKGSSLFELEVPGETGSGPSGESLRRTAGSSPRVEASGRSAVAEHDARASSVTTRARARPADTTGRTERGGGLRSGRLFRGRTGEIYFGVHRRDHEPASGAGPRLDTPPPVVLTGLRLSRREVPVGAASCPGGCPRWTSSRSLMANAWSPASSPPWVSVPRNGTGIVPARGLRPRLARPAARPAARSTYTNLAPGAIAFAWGREQRRRMERTGASLADPCRPPCWGRLVVPAACRRGRGRLVLLSVHRRADPRAAGAERELELEVHERRRPRTSWRERAAAPADRRRAPVLIAHVDGAAAAPSRTWRSEAMARRFPRRLSEGRRVEEMLPPELSATWSTGPWRGPSRAQGSSLRDRRRRSTRNRRIAATLVPHPGGNGTLRGVYTLAQDVTATRARRRKPAAGSRSELAHASRVLTLGELAAAIAHELNQPLTAILGNADAALRLQARAPPPAR